MTKSLFFLPAILFSTILLFAQDLKPDRARIKGIITTSDGKPAANVTVSIAHSKWGDISNDKGEYTVNQVKPGNWILKVSSVGAISQEKAITVTGGQILQVDFVLKENSAQLQEVVISARNFNKENRVVAKMPLKNLENPQVYNTVSSELMKQQGITAYDDALRNVPGISRTWESTGRAGDGASYFALRGFDAQPSLINGLPGLTSGNLDPADVEEIQVIKGPSSTLFGGSFYSYGGIINTITKKPYYDFGGELAYHIGSFGLHRVTADINTPLSKKQKLALRVNTAYATEKSFQDAGFRKSFFIAPSLAYEVDDRLSFQLLVEVLEEKRAVPPVFFNSDRFSPLDFKNIDELNLNPKLSFTSNDLTIRNPRYNVQAQMLYKLSGKWSSQTVISAGRVKSDGIYTYIWDDVAGDHWFSQYFHNENQRTFTLDIQQNFNADFKIGGLRNRLLVGLDYFHRNVKDNGSGWAMSRNVTPQGAVGYFDPFTGEPTDSIPLNKSAIDQLLAGTEGSNSNISNGSYSAYFSDVLNITPGLLAMVSLRGDYFVSKGEKSDDTDDYNQFALSPKFGLLYQAIPNRVSFFASYMNAFINVSPSQVYDQDGNFTGTRSFKPEHANQFEFGVKTNLVTEKVYVTLSMYDIKVSDRVIPDASNPLNSIQGGKVGSKGFELDFNARPYPGLSIIAGYSYNRAKIIDGNKDDFYSEPGRSPGGQGPQNLVNLWATYKFSQGKLRNFGFGFGGNYASRYKVIDNSNTGVFYLPSYALLNGSLFYNAKHFQVNFNVNNINNKEYYIGYWSVNPQKRRNFVASVAYRF